MKINLIEKKEILDYEKELGIELVANERNTPIDLKRFYVGFNAEIKDGVVLIGAYGDGKTIDEALKNYCELISGKTLVIGAYTKQRREVNVPHLVHTRGLDEELCVKERKPKKKRTHRYSCFWT